MSVRQYGKDVGRKWARALTAGSAVRRAARKASHAGLLPGWVWKRLPVQDTFWVSLPRETGFSYSSSHNDGIGRALHWRGFGSYEAETVDVFLRLARRSQRFVDVGANTGIYTLLACAVNPSLRVCAFEPVPRIYGRLCENVERNGWRDRCCLRNEAVSSFSGVTKFHVPYADLPVAASLRVDGWRGVEGELIDVPVTTIDAACPEPVDLVKIDVEHFEGKVLEGMQRVLAGSQPAIIAECYWDGPYRAVQHILTRFGYHFFHLRGEGPTAVAEIMPDPTERYKNYLYLPERCLEWLG